MKRVDARQIVAANQHLPLAEVGRKLVDAGHADTQYQGAFLCVLTYWQDNRASGQACNGKCQTIRNSRGHELCAHTGQACTKRQ